MKTKFRKAILTIHFKTKAMNDTANKITELLDN